MPKKTSEWSSACINLVSTTCLSTWPIWPPGENSTPESNYRILILQSIARHNLLSLGTCLGKFTQSGKFRLHITALDISMYIEVIITYPQSRSAQTSNILSQHPSRILQEITNPATSSVAPHARYKVWIKPNGEMPFLYGGNIVKAHIGRWSEDCPEHQGVVVLVSP